MGGFLVHTHVYAMCCGPATPGPVLCPRVKGNMVSGAKRIVIAVIQEDDSSDNSGHVIRMKTLTDSKKNAIQVQMCACVCVQVVSVCGLPHGVQLFCDAFFFK